MNTTEAFGLTYDVPMSNGQLEPAIAPLTDDKWLANKAAIEGRCGRPIDSSLHGNLVYLRAYLRGANATINPRLVLPDRLIDAEAQILLEFAEYAAATVRRLHALDADLAQPGWE